MLQDESAEAVESRRHRSLTHWDIHSLTSSRNNNFDDDDAGFEVRSVSEEVCAVKARFNKLCDAAPLPFRE
jgi:hypothetical protein